MSKKIYALSIRQPWASLIVAGLKTIEIRTWSTNIAEKIAIHASSTADDYQPAWDGLPEEHKTLGQLRGGVIGVAELVECRVYKTALHFTEEASLHRNDPAWFQSPRFGFVFTAPRIVPFRKVRGNSRFFFVDDPESSNG